MRPIAAFKSLPLSLRFACLMFLMTPLWSFAILHTATTPVTRGSFAAGIIALEYGIIPLALSVTLLIKSFVFVPLFLAECVVLFLHAAWELGTHPTSYQLFHFLTLAAASLFAVLFVSGDYIHPMVSRMTRGWRKAPRLKVNKTVEIAAEGKSTALVPAYLNDCSLTGISISGRWEDLGSLLYGRKPNDLFKLTLKIDEIEYHPVAEVVRRVSDDDIVLFGVRLHDDEVTAAILYQLGMEGRRPQVHWSEQILFRRYFRRAADGLWSVSLLALFLLPGSPLLPHAVTPAVTAAPQQQVRIEPKPSRRKVATRKRHQVKLSGIGLPPQAD